MTNEELAGLMITLLIVSVAIYATIELWGIYWRRKHIAKMEARRKELDALLRAAEARRKELDAHLQALVYTNPKHAADLETAGHRLALSLECLLMDTGDMLVVSKWWDSGMEALEGWRAVTQRADGGTK